MRSITHIMVHHSATPDGQTFSTQAIRRFHTSWRYNGTIIEPAKAREMVQQGVRGVIPPWRKIGYHRLIELVNDEVEAIVGRGDHESAAACPEGGMNECALHVCLVGDFDKAMPSSDMVRVAIERAIAPWRFAYGIAVEKIVGHRDFNPHKTCPGKMFDLELLREMVR